MKIFKFLDLGNAVGCQTLQEAFEYLYYHTPSIFSYDKIVEEENELMSELNKYNFIDTIETFDQNGNKITKKQIKPIQLAAALDIVNCCNCTNLTFTEFKDC